MIAAPNGAGRFDHVHGDEHLVLDVESFTARALEDVIETITSFGQYPQPQTDSSKPARRVEFSLEEYLVEEWDESDLAKFVIASLSQSRDDFDDTKAKLALSLEHNLREHLRDSQIVRDRAEQLAEEDRWDRS